MAERLVAEFDTDRVVAAVRYFDGQSEAGPGLLVNAVREGRTPQRRRATVESQVAYSEQVWGWVRDQFPELCDDHGQPHHVAVATVLRLHATIGKGQLTKAEHGPIILAAVDAYRRQHETEGA